MSKVSFTYKKEDGSVSERLILHPKFLKESYNNMNDFSKESVKYIQGYEVDKNGLSESEIRKYEEIIGDYFELVLPTLDEFIGEQGLDPKRIKSKAFKKEGISDFKTL
jgi:hypothetical protein